MLNQIKQYLILMRLNKPIGTLLLLWPTLWALWIAAKGFPDLHVLIVFIIGTFLMRSAGCVINDYADRHWDKHVTRTQHRPLTTGKISTRAAFVLFAVLSLCAFALVLTLNTLTILLSFGAVAITCIYPFTKRFTHLPQLFLSIAFAWGIPMAFAAQTNHVPMLAWYIFFITAIWIVMYDTQYALTDKEDDLKIGIKSTAILFGNYNRLIIFILQFIVVLGLILLGINLQLGRYYYFGLTIATSLFIYQHYLIKDQKPQFCLNAFLNNSWVGLAIFIGILLSYSI